MPKNHDSAVSTVQTTDNTPTVLAYFTVTEDHSAGMAIGMFVAKKKATGSGIYGGNVVASFRRTTTGNVSIDTVEVKRNSGPGGDFDCQVSGNDVQLVVTGRNNETWEWVCYSRIFTE